MTDRDHAYAASVRWIGPERGSTRTYAGYSREHVIAVDGVTSAIHGSADPVFRGDASLVNPEQSLVGALSACHLLSYLALCARARIEVLSYEDAARGTMRERAGSGAFTNVTLAPRVVVARAADVERATALHAEAHATCFIANSVNFEVYVEPSVTAA